MLDQPPAAAAALQGWPLLRLGFRPFYLGAALLACLSVPVWIALFLGHAELKLEISPLLWHAHEMLFGFAAGVIVGFLLTAVKAWTGLPTPRGALLGTLAFVWLAARVAAVVAPYPVYAALDMALLPAVALILLRVLIKAGNKRNIPLISLLVLMATANLVFHLSALGAIDVPPVAALYAGLALIVWGYGQARQAPVVLWSAPVWTRHLAALLMLVSMVLLAAAYVPRNGLKARLHHPMVLAVKVWALAHLLANNTLADLLLFGSFLLWAVADFRAARLRDRAAGTVYPPGSTAGTVRTLLVGVLAWAVFAFWGHALLIGVRPFG